MQYDVIIVGGSNAGLSAAMVLGRALRTVLVIDSGKPCNRQAPHSHSFLTRDGEVPGQLIHIAKQEVLAYPTVTILADKATQVRQLETGFAITTETDGQYTSRKLLLATGMEDLMLPIEGFAECWGRSVIHCPFCHGYEARDLRLGLFGNGETGYDYYRLIRNWNKNLTVFTNGPSTFTDEQQQALRYLKVPVIESPVVRIEHDNGILQAVHLQDGQRLQFDAVFSHVPFRQHSDLAQQLGCELTEHGYIHIEDSNQTSVPGVYAAGDNSSPMRQISFAVASGARAGAFLTRELVSNDWYEDVKLEIAS